NGKKIGDHVLDPVLTDYDKQVPYVVYELSAADFNSPGMTGTRTARRGGRTVSANDGTNTIAAVLGNGRYYSPRLTDPTTTRTFGNPKMLLQMDIEYNDGSTQTVVSDESWQISTEGPIRENCDYDGEIYDARMEIPYWNGSKNNGNTSAKNKFDAEKYGKLFQNVQIVDAPQGKLVSQVMPPMRINKTLKPISLNEVKPSVWVYDFGQNIVGLCTLKVKGPKGTEVTLRHAETLIPDGPEKDMLYVANLRGAKCRDIYTLSGEKVTETYTPRFTYHGFRFAEITGFPGKPTLDSLTAHSVNTDLPVAGKFECSNPLVNQIYKNIEWGVRDNYLSIPTDCPQRDERQGWQGDRAGESLGEMFIFDNHSLYTKWLKDIEDSQREDGNLSDVCPNFWPLYSSNVTWPSAFTIIPGSLCRMYNDERPIRQHYEGMKKWMNHLAQFILEDGTIEKDNYGDWCVPPEKPELIHSQDPARKTVPGILATSYYIHNLNLLAYYANLLGEQEEAAEFKEKAVTMTAAFNKRFYNAEKGQYDNGTQTSCVLPLAFGIVPEDEKQKVFNTLVNNIENVT
ncbi:MAG: family 78 glycoside hydrolase catalytic domain, partial [Thermoguttaceae bacterium]